MPLNRDEIVRLLKHLNDELVTEDVVGELFVLGGAVMCLVFEARQSTQDVDGYFKPTRVMRVAVKRVATSLGIADDWLNDAAKGYLSDKGEFDTFLELTNLRVMTASPAYLLAMKCLAMRLGEEFHDESDVRFLLRYLDITNYNAALEVISGYYPLDRFPQKTLYALEEILDQNSGDL